MTSTHVGPAPLKIGNYILDKTMGSGSFGKVKRGTHVVTGVPVAVKIINKDKLAKKADMAQKIRREIFNLKLFKHPHIIKLYEVIETSTDIFLVMELVEGGELFDYILRRGKLPEQEARHFFQQMISAVGYCHYHKVAHRDLKPENVLLSSSNALKIADFGLSNLIQDGEFLQTSCGSPNYAAPEVIDAKYYSGEEVDVWSSGVILYALLTAKLPFDDEFIPHLFNKIKRGKYKMPSFLSGPCQDLIRRMLIVDPLQRITIPEIKQHPWFKMDLPTYLQNFPDDNIDLHELFNPQILDASVLHDLQEFYGLTRQKLLDELKKEVEITTSLNQASGSTAGTPHNSYGTPASFSSPSPLSEEPSVRSTPLMVAYLLLYDRAESYMTPAAAVGRQLQNSNRYSARNSVAQSIAELSTSPPMNLRDEMTFLDPGANLNVLQAITNQSPIVSPSRPLQFGDSSNTKDADSAGPQLVQDISTAIGDFSIPDSSTTAKNPTTTSTTRLPWYLGILSTKNPAGIMKEVYRALKKLNFEWKVISPYQIQARAIQPKSSSSTLQSSLGISQYNSFSGSHPSLPSYSNLSSTPSPTHTSSGLSASQGSNVTPATRSKSFIVNPSTPEGITSTPKQKKELTVTNASNTSPSSTSAAAAASSPSSASTSKSSPGAGQKNSFESSPRVQVPINISNSIATPALGMKYNSGLLFGEQDSSLALPDDPVPADPMNSTSKLLRQNVPGTPSEINEPYVKLVIQLFKVIPRKESQTIMHLLDVKKVQGQPIAFFDLCGTLMQELKI